MVVLSTVQIHKPNLESVFLKCWFQKTLRYAAAMPKDMAIHASKTARAD